MLHKLKAQGISNYLFCIVIGSFYIYSLALTIFSATIVRVSTFSLFTTGLISVLIFLVVFYNRITILVSSAALILFGLYVIHLIRADAFYPHFHPLIDHFNQLFFVVTGEVPYDPALARTIVWAVCLMLGAVVALLMLHKSNFIVFAAIGIAVFMLTWGPGFSRDPMSFLIFFFVFCALLIRKMNNSASATLMVAPICIIAIAITHINIPQTSDLFVRRHINQYLTRAGEAISDRIFELFNPTYFSFQSTGFSGAGGRLGGPVTLNSRAVMDVISPGGIYLSGAISNTYTGYRWIPTLQEGDIYTHGLTPGQFEMLETVAALIRGATMAHYSTNLSHAELMQLVGDIMGLNATYFGSVGVTAGNYHLHSYLPTATVTIDMGRQRTGTVFRPSNAWNLTFNPSGTDYLPQISVLPTGDIQAPRLMSRNTTYAMHFLNVNTHFGFVEEVLRQSSGGVYAARTPQTDWRNQIVTFDGRVAGTPFLSDARIFSFGGFWGLHDVGIGHGYWGEFTSAPLDSLLAYSVLQDTRIPDVFLDALNTGYFGIDQMLALFNAFGNYIYMMPQRGVLGQIGVVAPGTIGSERHNTHIPHESYLIQWLDTFSTDVLATYAEQVRYHFTQVPDIVPARVHELTMEIIEGATNDFDRVMAIRSYLLQFRYELNTVPVPPGVCFVDHFLFETQEGYCTYFASAMAVMARIAGVPSRYVEGFVLPPSRYDIVSTPVTNRMAHAWVEVYLEGFGWMIVEATPSYAFLMNPEEFLGAAPGTEFDQDWLREMHERMFSSGGWDPELDDWEYYWYYWEQGETMPTSPMPPNETDPVSIGARVGTAVRALFFMVLAGMALVAFARFMQLTYALIKVRRYEPNKKAITYFKGVLDLVIFNTVPMRDGETPKAFGTHTGKRFKFKGGSVYFEDLITLYYKAKYSPHTITVSEGNLMEEAYFDMINFIRQKNKPLKVIYLRYVRGLGAI